MALSGSLTTSTYESRNYVFSWTATQSIVDNTSTISWKLVSGGVTPWRAERTVNIYINDSHLFNKETRVERYGGETVASGTRTISHNSDGSKTFTVTVEVDVYYDYTTSSGSQTFTLDTIPRQSSLSVSDGTIGTAQTLTVTQQSSSFTHSIYCWKGSSGWYIKADGGTSSSKVIHNDCSIPFAVPLSILYQQTDSSTAMQVSFKLTTYHGSTNIGSTNYYVYFAIPTSVKPTIPTLSIGDSAGCFSEYGAFVQGKSIPYFDITASGSYGSTILYYRAEIDNQVMGGSSSYLESGTVLKNAGTISYSVTATDSRSRSSDANTGSITVLAYDSPTVSINSVKRTDSSGTASLSGAYLTVAYTGTVSSLNSKNIATYILKYKQTSASSWTSVTLSPSNTYSASGTYIFPADTSSSYNIMVTVTDNFISNSDSATGGTTSKVWSILKKGLGFAFGKVAEKENTLEVAWDTHMYGDLTVDGDIDGTANIAKSLVTCRVGQSSSTTTNPWYKVASVNLAESGTYVDKSATFLVDLPFSTNKHVGILRIRVRSDSDLSVANCGAEWLCATNDITLSNFVLAYSTTAPGVVELWVKVDTAYAIYHFTLLRESYRNSGGYDLWTLYNQLSAGYASAPTSGYTQVTSTTLPLKDGVYAYGTSGIWSYRKWSNGLAECWGVVENSSVAMTAAWGNVYQASSAFSAQTLPFEFIATPRVFADVDRNPSSGAQAWLTPTSPASTTKTPSYAAVRATSYTCPLNISLYVIGMWK